MQVIFYTINGISKTASPPTAATAVAQRTISNSRSMVIASCTRFSAFMVLSLVVASIPFNILLSFTEFQCIICFIFDLFSCFFFWIGVHYS